MNNREIAELIISVYVSFAVKENGVFMTYGELANRIGRPGQHRLLGGPLDVVRDICASKHIPDISTLIVDKASLLDGTVKPSSSAIKKYSGWENLRGEQSKAIEFDWSSIVD